MHVHTLAHIYTYTKHAYTTVCTLMCTRTYKHTQMFTCTYTHLHAHTYTCMYTHIHVHKFIKFSLSMTFSGHSSLVK